MNMPKIAKSVNAFLDSWRDAPFILKKLHVHGYRGCLLVSGGQTRFGRPMGIQSGAPRIPTQKTGSRFRKGWRPTSCARGISRQPGGRHRAFRGRKPGWGQMGGVDTSKRLGTRGRWVQRQPPPRRRERARVVGGMPR